MKADHFLSAGHIRHNEHQLDAPGRRRPRGMRGLNCILSCKLAGSYPRPEPGKKLKG